MTGGPWLPQAVNPAAPPTAPGAVIDAAAVEPRPWGPWATIGWTLLASAVGMFVALVIGFIVGIVVGFIAAVTQQASSVEELLEANMGAFELTAYLAMFAAALAFFVIPIRVRRFRYAEYIRLTPCRLRHYLFALLAILLFVGIEHGLTVLLDRPMPESMTQLWQTSGSVVLLLFVVVIAGPIAEEMFFRGFLYRGLAGTRLGPALPILVTSLLWTAIHIQYELPELTYIFVAGLLIGWSRHASGSIRPAILMHVTMNAIAMAVLTAHYAELS